MTEDEQAKVEPPPHTLAWLHWYAENRIAEVDLTDQERAFALDKGGKIIDFAMRGFWQQHKKHNIRHHSPAAACAFALAWLQRWAAEMEANGKIE